MRRLIAIFIISSTILYSILLCNADEQNSRQKDLPLAVKYETKQKIEQLDAYTKEIETALIEQELNLSMLSSLYNLGYVYNQPFDGESLQRAMNCYNSFPLDAPIYRSEIFKGYYKLRTEKFLKQYRISQVFDYGAFTKTSRLEFDNYMKSIMKSEAMRKELAVLLQEKLLDKLVELESGKRKAVLEEIYVLRLPANTSLCNDYIYQIFEHGVRIEVLKERLEINKEELSRLAKEVAISMKVEKSGMLLIKYKNAEGATDALQVINATKNAQSYNGYTVLHELYGKQDCSLVFIDENDKEYIVAMEKALKEISVDEKGYLQLKLDHLLEPVKADEAVSQDLQSAVNKDSKSYEEQVKTLETYYSSKAIEAQGIIKELNRYSIYLELKNKGMNNYFTRNFEVNQKAWKSAMETKLGRFGPGGMADFAAFIKQFVLASRSDGGKSDRGRVLTAKFRNSVMQFRQPDESSIWVTDMLYNFKYMK